MPTYPPSALSNDFRKLYNMMRPPAPELLDNSIPGLADVEARLPGIANEPGLLPTKKIPGLEDAMKNAMDKRLEAQSKMKPDTPADPNLLNKGLMVYNYLAGATAAAGGIFERESGGLRAPGFAPTTSATLATLGTTVGGPIGTAVGAGVGLAIDTARFIKGRQKYNQDLYKQGLQDSIYSRKKSQGLDYSGLTYGDGKPRKDPPVKKAPPGEHERLLRESEDYAKFIAVQDVLAKKGIKLNEEDLQVLANTYVVSSMNQSQRTAEKPWDDNFYRFYNQTWGGDWPVEANKQVLDRSKLNRTSKHLGRQAGVSIDEIHNPIKYTGDADAIWGGDQTFNDGRPRPHRSAAGRPAKVEGGEIAVDGNSRISKVFQGANHEGGGVNTQVRDDEAILSRGAAMAMFTLLKNQRDQRLKAAIEDTDRKQRNVSQSPYNGGANYRGGRDRYTYEGGEDRLFDMASAANALTLGHALLSEERGSIRGKNITPARFTPDTRQFDIAESNARQQSAGQLQSLSRQVRGDAGKMALAKQAGATQASIAANAAGQRQQYLAGVQTANQQAGMQAAMANQQAALQAESADAQMRLQYDSLRSKAASTSLSGIFANQLAKRQSEENKIKAKYDNAVSQAVLAKYVNEDLLSSPSYLEYLKSRKSAIQEEIGKEIGDVEDPNNPIYGDEFKQYYEQNKPQFTELMDRTKAELTKRLEELDQDSEDYKKVSEALKNIEDNYDQKLEELGKGMYINQRISSELSKRYNPAVERQKYLEQYGVPVPDFNELFN